MKFYWLFIVTVYKLGICDGQILSTAITFNASVTEDFANNFNGGIKKGYTNIGLEQIDFNINTEKAGFWKDGDLFIHLINAHGNGPSKDLTGDIQVVSNIEAGDYTGLYEIYYTQQVSRFFFLLGQHDLNTEFVGTKYGENFINSSFGIIPSISLNVPVSIYPVAAPCMLLKFNASENLIFKFASYDGDPGGIENNRFNLNWNIDAQEGFMNISEVEYSVFRHEQRGIYTQYGIKVGTYKLGIYYHTGSFKNYKDTLQEVNGNLGLYLLADQMIIPKPSNPEEGLAAMIQFGISPGKQNLISHYIGLGVRYHGIISGRSSDFVGMAMAKALIGNSAESSDKQLANSETTYELTYKFEFNDGRFVFQPNIQYVVNPGALKFTENVLVGLLRFQINY